MKPTIRVIDKDLIDIELKLEDDCIFGFTLDRKEINSLILDLNNALWEMKLLEKNNK
jgi:hypothetical protein